MSFIKDLFFGGAEEEAAAARERGITEGIGEQRRQFDVTREDFAGFRERGGLAGEREAEFLGLRGPEAERVALEGFTESPGQAFLRERGLRAANRAASVSGGLGGGNILEELQRRGIGFAGQFLGERLDRLAGVASGGLQATTAGAGFGGNISANIANLLGQRGEARGAGIENVAERRRSGISRVAGAIPFPGNLSRIASAFQG